MSASTNLDETGELSFIRVRVSNLNKSLDFYRGLGLSPRANEKNEASGDGNSRSQRQTALLHTGPFLLLEQGEEGDPAAPKKRIRLVAQSIKEVVQRMKGLGFNPTSSSNSPSLTTFVDCDGNTVELTPSTNNRSLISSFLTGTSAGVDLARAEIDPSFMVQAIAVDAPAATVDVLLGQANSDRKRSWTVTTPPKCVKLPLPLGDAVEVCLTRSKDGASVTLVSYPHQLLSKKIQKKIQSSSVLSSPLNNQKNKVVLVTGCDSGIGRSLVWQLAGLGFHVVAACYSAQGAKFLDQLADTVVADLTTDEGVQQVVSAVHKQCDSGKELWAVVNNAGAAAPGHVEWVQSETRKKVMDLNYHAPANILHELVPLLKQSKGRAVNVTSVCGIVAAPSNSAYSASKFALEALSDSLRAEMKPFGVDVVVVEPGTMHTPVATSFVKIWKQSYDDWRARIETTTATTTSGGTSSTTSSAYAAAVAVIAEKDYPKDWAEELSKGIAEYIEVAAEDHMIAVKELLACLLMESKHLPTRALCGEGSKQYKFLQRLPDRWRDSMMGAPYREAYAEAIAEKEKKEAAQKASKKWLYVVAAGVVASVAVFAGSSHLRKTFA